MCITLNILFWNTYRAKNKDNIDNCLIDIIQEKECDLIILAEYNKPIRQLVNMINIKSNIEYKPIPNNGVCNKIKGIIKKRYKIEILQEQARYQIIKIETTYYLKEEKIS